MLELTANAPTKAGKHVTSKTASAQRPHATYCIPADDRLLQEDQRPSPEWSHIYRRL